MYRISSVILIAVLGLCIGSPSAVAQDAPPEQSHTTAGALKSVDTEANSFVLTAGDTNITLRVSDATSFTLDGEPTEMDDVLWQGNNVVVTHSESIALRVAASTVQAAHDAGPESGDEPGQ